jgi:soluble lytic murein transglycosylase-like protein
MQIRRGFAALIVVSTLLSGVTPVLAQVDEAERRARETSEEVDTAYAVVSEAVANAREVEAALFIALDEYQIAAVDLAAASIRLDQVTRSLTFADAEAVAAEQTLHSHTVTAYMEAVTSTASIVLDTGTVEDALVVGQVVRESQTNALSTLSDLLAQRNELERLRADHAIELVQVETLQQSLASRTAELQELFIAANAEVAAAFTMASAADAAHRAALDDVDRALAEEEAARRAATTTTTRPDTTTTAPPTTTTTPPPATTAADDTTTTTTLATTTTTTSAPAGSWPPIPISDRVLAWRPVLEQYFAADLVLDSMVIMQCESLGDPDALNPYSGASGLFQFMPGTWAVASVKAGVGDRSVFDGEANIIAAAWLAEYYRTNSGDPWRPWTCRSHL